MSKRSLSTASVVGLATIFLATMGVAASVALGKGKPSATDTTTTSTLSQITSTASDTTTTAQAASKVLVCHRTHSTKKPFHTINVSSRAVPAHLAHGDTLGACVLVGAASSSTQGTGPGNGRGRGNANGHSK